MLHPQFAAVDFLPFLGLPLTAIPWILIALGLVLIGLAGWIVRVRVRGRGPLAAAAVLGLAMLVIPLALASPRKASDAQRVQTVGRVALSQAAVNGATKANILIDGLVTQVETTIVPAVADRPRGDRRSAERDDRSRLSQGCKGARGMVVDQARRDPPRFASEGERWRRGSHERPRLQAAPWYIMGPASCSVAADMAFVIDRQPTKDHRVRTRSAERRTSALMQRT
jgi:hypothetical protein